VVTGAKTVTGTAEIVALTDYYAFGAVARKYVNAGEGQEWGFHGMKRDAGVDSDDEDYTTEFRQYDSDLGRWLSPDPLMSDAPGWSPYNFNWNNPVNNTDPSGLWPDEPTGGGYNPIACQTCGYGNDASTGGGGGGGGGAGIIGSIVKVLKMVATVVMKAAPYIKAASDVVNHQAEKNRTTKKVFGDDVELNDHNPSSPTGSTISATEERFVDRAAEESWLIYPIADAAYITLTGSDSHLNDDPVLGSEKGNAGVETILMIVPWSKLSNLAKVSRTMKLTPKVLLLESQGMRLKRTATNPVLKETIEYLWREDASHGDGSTGAMIIKEITEGVVTSKSGSHVTKAIGALNTLRKLLKGNFGNLSESDRQIIFEIIENLTNGTGLKY
jgi:RHS repeat-associated protein